MPPQVRVVVNGPELRAFVKTLPEVRAGTQAVAEDIAATARRIAPQSPTGTPQDPPGTLRDSIRVRRTMRSGRESQTVRVEARIYYARFVEFGTRFMSARPFLRPAAARYRHRPAASGQGG